MARPRSFEPEAALHAIKCVFWEKGYEGTSMRDIEAETGLNKQSLYRLFGDKRGMYLRALADYEERELGEILEALQPDGSPNERFSRLFVRIIDGPILHSDRRGCFLCNACVDQAQIDPETGKLVEAMMQSLHKVFMGALMTASVYEIDRCKTERASAHMMAAYFGLRVLIKANLSKSVLHHASLVATSQLEE
jgi:TetR/AcrR family transcriptional repressor of nem operon